MSQTELTLLYDGACAMCAGEIARLRRMGRAKGSVSFVDISATDFDPAPYGVTFADMMRQIHAVRRDGSLLTGVDALHAAYREAGIGWLLAPTRWPGLRSVFDRAYLLFAQNRYRLGRAPACRDGPCAKA